jgi:hypothetical protein
MNINNIKNLNNDELLQLRAKIVQHVETLEEKKSKVEEINAGKSAKPTR